VIDMTPKEINFWVRKVNEMLEAKAAQYRKAAKR